MEVQDYVSVVRRRWWLLLCPFAAMAAVVLVTVSRPASFTSTATVSALAVSGGPTGQYSGTSGAKTFVANFQAALRSPSVIAEVVQATGVRVADARNGLSSAPVGESTIIEVTYRTASRAQAEPVATEAAKRTMSFLFESQIVLAEEPLAKATEELIAADQKLADFTRGASTPVPDRDYQILADQISSLQTLQAESAARQEISIAARYSGEISAKRGELAKLATTLAEYNALTAARSDAVSAVTASRQNLDQARAQFAAGDPNRIITPGEAVKVSRLGPAAKGGVTAFVSGLFFAAGIALLLELRRSQKLVAAADPSATGLAALGPAPLRPDVAEPRAADTSVSEPRAADTSVSEPVPAETLFSEPVPAETPVSEPRAADTSVSEPVPAETSVSEPGAADTSVSEPGAADTLFSEPGAAAPRPTEPRPNGPTAAERAPTERKPTDWWWTGLEPAPPEPSEPKAADAVPNGPARGDSLPQDA